MGTGRATLSAQYQTPGEDWNFHGPQKIFFSWRNKTWNYFSTHWIHYITLAGWRVCCNSQMNTSLFPEEQCSLKKNNQLDFYHWCLRLFTCFWSSHQAIAFSTCFLRWSNLKWNDWIYEASCVSYHGKHIFRIKANNIQVMFTTYSLHGLIRLRALSAKSWSKNIWKWLPALELGIY